MFRTLAPVAAVLALGMAGSLAGPTMAEPLTVQRGVTSTLELAKDSAVVVESETAFAELTIATPEIADISTLSDRSIYVLGKKPGRTTLMMLNADGQVMTIVNIQVTPDIAEFRERLTEILPGEAIEARPASDGIVLSGSVSSRARMDQALELASRYAEGRVSNLMTIKAGPAAPALDLAGFTAELQSILPDEKVEARVVNGTLVLSGAVSTIAARDRVQALAESYASGQVQNLTTAIETPDIAGLIGQLQAILPGEAVEAHQVGGAIVLSGRVSSEERKAQAVQIAQLFAPGWAVSDLMTLRSECFVRTRRGSEVVELPVPCTD